MTAIFGPFENDFTITPERFDALGKLSPEGTHPQPKHVIGYSA